MRKGYRKFRIAVKEDIGAMAMPADNSFCIKTSDGSEASLANEYVTIGTRPVKLKVRGSKLRTRWKEREFVLVTFKEETYRVINCFHKIVRPGQTNWVGAEELSKLLPKHGDSSPYKYKFGDQNEVGCGILGVIRNPTKSKKK